MADTKKKTTRSRSSNGRPKAVEAARAAAEQFIELTGRRPTSVLGVDRDDDGWKVTFELVELERIPNSTDLLGAYVVHVDDDGDLLGYERTRRYQRGQADGGGQ